MAGPGEGSVAEPGAEPGRSPDASSDMSAHLHTAAGPAMPPPTPAGTDAAFDRWLRQELSRLYDSALSEPVPAELLKLLEEGGEG